MQEVEKMKRLRYHKVAGVTNPADLMTKGVARAKIAQYADMVKQEMREGRAEKSLRMSGER